MSATDFAEDMFIITDPVTILLFIILVLYLVYELYGSQKGTYQNFPPGPRPFPFIGNIHNINLKKPYKTYAEFTKKYGSVFSVQLGTEKRVVLCGYETVKDALVNYADAFAERPKVPICRDIANGYGILFSHGENWKIMRRFTISKLRDLGMGRSIIEDKINEECDYLVERFNTYGGKPFDNFSIINAAAANVIVYILFGHRLEFDNPMFVRLMSLMNDNLRLMGSPMITMYNTFPSLMRWIPGSHKNIKKNAAEIQNVIKEIIAQHMDQLDVNDQRNLIDEFLVKQQEEKLNLGTYFHNDNLIMVVSNLFTAGMETTSSTLQWGILLMMKYPEIQRNVQNEIEKVIGSAQPQIEHRKDLPYTDAVIHERETAFANIVPGNLPHETTQDVTFRGYFLPKGTYVVPFLTSVLYDKDYFEKADEFYPEHFLDSEGNFVKNKAFMPFSAGRRSCVGENLAKMEFFLFFTRLLQKFTFQRPPGAALDLTTAVGITTPPVPYECCAFPRP
ncbi:cytochrome P450 2K1-like [Rhinophrynus dorsalis]